MTYKKLRFIFCCFTVFLNFEFWLRNHSCIFSKNFSLTILHTNDAHGNVKCKPYLKILADEKKKNGENILVASAGDVFIGSLNEQILHRQSAVLQKYIKNHMTVLNLGNNKIKK